MSVNGVPFLLFVLLSVILYYAVPLKKRWIVLLLGSTVFYLSYSVLAAVYLAVTIVFTYGFGIFLEKLAAQKPEGETAQERRAKKLQLTKKKRAVLATALIINFAVLWVLKYSGFMVNNINGIAGYEVIPIPDFLLPLGISFYIFQTSGYLIDVQRGKYKAQKNIIKYTLFVSYFPQMVQGPINRYDYMEKSLYDGNEFKWENIQHGILRMMFGILKKAMIADTLAPVVEVIYSGYSNYPGIVSFLGAGLYCIQLYCDFSGGVDILCGVSQLFGVCMMENFAQPYFAVSLSDFWRRWHMSLGEWMKDYLFYPLALSKFCGRLTKHAKKVLPIEIAKRLTPCFATIVVFLAVGIWQGPGWANIAYGLWNGFWMSLGLLWVPVGAKLNKYFESNKGKVFLTVWGILRTNFLVIIGRYFSNAESLRSALGMLGHTFFAPGFGGMNCGILAEIGLDSAVLVKAAIALTVLFIISFAKEKGIDVWKWLCTRKWYFQFVVLFVCLFLIVLGVYGNSNYTPIAYVYENV